MRETLDKKLGKFLRERRGEMSYDAFARMIGTNKSSLYRLERGEESITLRRLQTILDRLKVSVSDVFGAE
jgi:transcriptional regulator with XRE-family HTH domain